MIGALIIAGSITALGWMAFEFWRAPVGYETEDGFFFGEPGDEQ